MEKKSKHGLKSTGVSDSSPTQPSNQNGGGDLEQGQWRAHTKNVKDVLQVGHLTIYKNQTN